MGIVLFCKFILSQTLVLGLQKLVVQSLKGDRNLRQLLNRAYIAIFLSYVSQKK